MQSNPDDVVAVGGGTVGMGSRIDFDDFYRAELPRLAALARALCGSAVADDVAQEAMLAAYRRWRQVSDLEHPEAWVRRACSNLAVSQYRRRLVELRAATRLAGRLQPVPLEADDDEFWACVRGLPKRQAQVAALRYLYQLDVADIARTLEITEGSVKQHLSRGRARLVRELNLTDAREQPQPVEEVES
ncbi:MAG: sigma-70 family RNA polymerase sigma factor [Nocardioides sp.]